MLLQSVIDTNQIAEGYQPYVPATAPYPGAGSDIQQWAARQVEKVRAALKSGRLNFAPYLDPMTDETAEIRAAYPRMLRDGPIRAALMTKVLAVSQLDLQVHPREEDNPRHKEAGEFVRYALGKIESAVNWMGPQGIAWTVLSGACVQGYSASEKVWNEQVEPWGRFKGKRIYRALKGKDPEQLRLLIDQYRNLTGITSPHFNGSQVFPPDQFVFYSHLSWYENPAGSSDLRAAYGNWWRKNITMQLWDLHLEKFTSPMLKGTYTDVAKKAALEEAMENARSNTWLTVPPGTVVEAMHLATGTETAEFEKRCRYLDEQSLIAIVGAYLHILTGVQADRGDTAISKETSELFQWMLSATLAGVVQKQLVTPLILENYADVEPPGITYGSISDEVMLKRVQLIKAMQEVGMKPSAREAYQYLSVTEAVDERDTLVPPLAAPAPLFSEEDEPDTFGDDDPTPRKPAPRSLPLRPPSSLPKRSADKSSSGSAPIGDQQPLAGNDGAKAEALLRQAREAGTQALADVSARAVKRLLQAGPGALRAKSLYSNEELSEIADTLASINATGELLGRSRIRRRMTQASAIAEDPTDFSVFADTIPLMTPVEALDYFTNLVPTLGVDPNRFGVQQERQAFTLAAATDEVVLQRVQAVIRQRLQDGSDVKATGKEIAAVLDAAGVSVRNPQYAEMVARTNLRDSYLTGSQRELSQVADYFPVYKYVGIRDGRQGEDHEPHFDHYYPSSVPFTTVRGKRIYNCRCDFIPITADEWEELQAGGAVLSAA